MPSIFVSFGCSENMLDRVKTEIWCFLHISKAMMLMMSVCSKFFNFIPFLSSYKILCSMFSILDFITSAYLISFLLEIFVVLFLWSSLHHCTMHYNFNIAQFKYYSLWLEWLVWRIAFGREYMLLLHQCIVWQKLWSHCIFSILYLDWNPA